MRTIWEFPLEVTGEQVVTLPGGSEPLTVQEQNGGPCLWALVDPAEPNRRPWTIRIVGTGHPLEPGFDLQYLATFQLHNGALVFHVFHDGGRNGR